MDLPPPQIVCIAQVVHAEARGESAMGQRAIVHVILNRSKKLKKSPCIIVRMPGQFQIKFRRSYSGKSWNLALQSAYHPGRDPTAGAIYFKNRSSATSWKYKLTTSIGNHNFYK